MAVLVVDDDELVQVVANEILTEAGFHVMEARDAREALDLLETTSSVRVVFTDWNMPGLTDGLELARLIRELWPTIGVIVTSGKMRPSPDSLPSGVRFISKPYRSSVLVEEIRSVMHAKTEQHAHGGPVVPEGIAMQTPLMSEIGGIGNAAAAPEADKS